MPASRQDLFDRLAALGIATRTTEHRAVFTVAESSELERDLPGGHTKNLFLKDARGELFLVIALSATEIDIKALATAVGARRFSFGSAALLAEVLGVEPGSVTPFALMNDTSRRVQVVIDAALMEYDTINCHPLENTATTNVAREELLRFIRACGHEPRIARLAGAAAGRVAEAPGAARPAR